MTVGGCPRTSCDVRGPHGLEKHRRAGPDPTAQRQRGPLTAMPV